MARRHRPTCRCEPPMGARSQAVKHRFFERRGEQPACLYVAFIIQTARTVSPSDSALAASTIDLWVAAGRTLAYEAPHSGCSTLISWRGFGGSGRREAVGVRVGNWLTAEQGRDCSKHSTRHPALRTRLRDHRRTPPRLRRAEPAGVKVDDLFTPPGASRTR